MRIDQIGLQETHLREISGDSYHTHMVSHSKGVMLGISKALAWILASKFIDSVGRYIILKGYLNSNIVTMKIYTANFGQSEVWDKIYLDLGETPYQEIIMLVNFNAVLDINLDRRTVVLSRIFLHYKVQCELIDVWRYKNSSLRDYTFPTLLSEISPLHRHYSCVPSKLGANIHSVTIGNRIYSNHSPVVAQWESHITSTRPRHWCLNNFILGCKGLREKVTSEIDFFLKSYEGSANENVIWDSLKAYIQGILGKSISGGLPKLADS